MKFKYIKCLPKEPLREWFNVLATLCDLLYYFELPWSLFHLRQEILAYLQQYFLDQIQTPRDYLQKQGKPGNIIMDEM